MTTFPGLDVLVGFLDEKLFGMPMLMVNTTARITRNSELKDKCIISCLRCAICGSTERRSHTYLQSQVGFVLHLNLKLSPCAWSGTPGHCSAVPKPGRTSIGGSQDGFQGAIAAVALTNFAGDHGSETGHTGVFLKAAPA